MLTKNPISFAVPFFVIFLCVTQGETAVRNLGHLRIINIFDVPVTVLPNPGVPPSPAATAPPRPAAKAPVVNPVYPTPRPVAPAQPVYPKPTPVAPVQPAQRPAVPQYSRPVLAYLQKWHGLSTRLGIINRAPYHLLLTSCADCVPYIVNCKFPISNVSVLRGIHVRSSRSTAPWLKRIGAIPVLLAGADTPAALQKGEIDCVAAGGARP